MTAHHPALRTPACDLFGVEFPLVQTGMGWVSGARLTAATSSAGGLGILASATMTLEELKVAVGKVKERTDKPFGVNLLPNQPDAAERLDLVIAEGVPVVSFAAAPRPEQVAKLNDAGVFHYWQLAALTAADAEKLDADLKLNGRIVRDSWIDQARTLLSA